MRKTKEEWVNAVKDPRIKELLIHNINNHPIPWIEDSWSTFQLLICTTFDWSKTAQGYIFWVHVSIKNEDVSYSDFKHLDKSVLTRPNVRKHTMNKNI